MENPQLKEDGKNSSHIDLSIDNPLHDKSLIEICSNQGKPIIETHLDGNKSIIETHLDGDKSIIETHSNGDKSMSEIHLDGDKPMSEIHLDGDKSIIETHSNEDKFPTRVNNNMSVEKFSFPKKVWLILTNIRFNVIISFISMLTFIGVYYLSFLTVPPNPEGEKTNVGIIVVIAVIFTLIFYTEFGYIREIYKNQQVNNIEWHIRKIVWNSLLLFCMGLGSVSAIWFFIIRSQELEIYNDLISHFDIIQKIIFSLDIIVLFIIIVFISYHLYYHLNNIQRIYDETNSGKMKREKEKIILSS